MDGVARAWRLKPRSGRDFTWGCCAWGKFHGEVIEVEMGGPRKTKRGAVVWETNPFIAVQSPGSLDVLEEEHNRTEDKIFPETKSAVRKAWP